VKEKLGDLSGTYNYHYDLKVRENELQKLIPVLRISGFVSPVFRNKSAVL
jgi:hypothetical protein